MALFLARACLFRGSLTLRCPNRVRVRVRVLLRLQLPCQLMTIKFVSLRDLAGREVSQNALERVHDPDSREIVLKGAHRRLGRLAREVAASRRGGAEG